jgi:hypothetical protein
MQRNMELIIKILKHLEARNEITVIETLNLDGEDDRVVAYHLRRMFEAGLLDAESVVSSTTPTRIIRVLPFGLSWAGHEFLESIKNQTVFNKLKNRLGDSLSSVPFELIKELAISLGKEQLGL